MGKPRSFPFPDGRIHPGFHPGLLHLGPFSQRSPTLPAAWDGAGLGVPQAHTVQGHPWEARCTPGSRDSPDPAGLGSLTSVPCAECVRIRPFPAHGCFCRQVRALGVGWGESNMGVGSPSMSLGERRGRTADAKAHHVSSVPSAGPARELRVTRTSTPSGVCVFGVLAVCHIVQRAV